MTESKISGRRLFLWSHGAGRLRCLGALVALTACGCAGSVPRLGPLPPPVLTITPDDVAYQAARPGTVSVKSYSFPGKVIACATDSLDQNLVVLYEIGEKKMSGLAVISVSDDSVRGTWKVPAGSQIMSVRAFLIWLRVPTSPASTAYLLSMNTGSLLAEFPRYRCWNYRSVGPAMYGNHGDTLYSWEQDSGKLLWKRPVRSAGPDHIPLWRLSNHLFVVQKDIACVRPEDGTGWTQEAKTYDEGVTGGGFSTFRAGGQLISVPQATMAYSFGLHSNPLEFLDEVAFCSKERLEAWDLNTGAPRWSRELTGRRGPSGLLQLDDQTGALVRFGGYYEGAEWRSAKNPYVAGFRLDTGEELWRLGPEKQDRLPGAPESSRWERSDLRTISSTVVWHDLCVFSTRGKVRGVDRQGRLRIDLYLPEDLTSSDLLIRGDRLILVSRKRIAAYSRDAMEFAWTWTVASKLAAYFCDYGEALRGTDIFKGQGFEPRSPPLDDPNQVWIIQQDGTLTGLDAATGEVRFSMPLGPMDGGIKATRRLYMTRSGSKLRVLRLDALTQALE